MMSQTLINQLLFGLLEPSGKVNDKDSRAETRKKILELEEEDPETCVQCGEDAALSTRDRISLCRYCGEVYLEENRRPEILVEQVAVAICMETSSGCPNHDGPVFLTTLTDPSDSEKFSRKTGLEPEKFVLVNPNQYIGLLVVESGERCENCFERGSYSVDYVGTEEEVADWIKLNSGFLPYDEMAVGCSFSYQDLLEEIDNGPLTF